MSITYSAYFRHKAGVLPLNALRFPGGSCRMSVRRAAAGASFNCRV